MSLIEDLEKAWKEAEKIEKCQAGEIGRASCRERV